MNKKVIYSWEIAGFFVIVIIGTLSHFCFDFFNQSKLVAALCPVNESVWEHLKLAFWPALLFALLEFYYVEKSYKNFWTAKALSLFIMPLVIAVLFYLYTSILGRNFLFLDISIFIIAVFAGQIVSYKFITSYTDYSRFNRVSTIAILILLAAFIVLTFLQPRLGLFMDPQNSTYGIPKK